MAFYILAGYGLSKIPDFPIQIIVIGIILAVSGFSLHEQVYSQEPDEPWDEVVNHIESDYDNQSNVLYNGHWVRFAFEKYGEKTLRLTVYLRNICMILTITTSLSQRKETR